MLAITAHPQGDIDMPSRLSLRLRRLPRRAGLSLRRAGQAVRRIGQPRVHDITPEVRALLTGHRGVF
jgi:hypothetical protein